MGLFSKRKNEDEHPEGLTWYQDQNSEVVYPHDWTPEMIEEYELNQRKLGAAAQQNVTPEMVLARSSSITVCSNCNETFMSIYDYCSHCGYPRR